MKKLLAVILIITLQAEFFLTLAEAANYFFSTTGSGSTCSDVSPCGIGTITTKGAPGDFLIVADGTYTRSAPLVFNCSSTTPSGTPGNPITVVAANERQAFIDASGGLVGGSNAAVVHITGCSYRNFEGLRLKYGDFADAANNADLVGIYNSSHLEFKRNLLSHSNRDRNAHLLDLASNVTDSLFEDNEFYNYHRYAMIDFGGGGRNTFRRNYANGRGYSPAVGFTSYNASTGGDLWENNIVENSQYGLKDTANSPNMAMIGNISLNNQTCFVTETHDISDGGSVVTPSIKDLVCINPSGQGLYLRTANGTTVDGFTIFGGAGTANGILADDDSGFGTANGLTSSFFAKNGTIMNVTGSPGTGVFTRSQTDWSLDYPALFGNDTPYDPDDGHITHKVTLASNPFGSCKVFVPDGATALKGTGLGGVDVGANILYASIDGVLQDGQSGHGVLKLWDTSDGSWTQRRALVTGVNDSDALVDIQDRLHSGCTGAAWPSTYADVLALTGTVSLNLSSVVAGAPIIATADADAPGDVAHWLGIYLQGAPGEDYLSNWVFLSGTQVKPGSPVLAATPFTFTAPGVAGEYEVRFYCCDTIDNLMDSKPFTVTAGSPTPSFGLGSGSTLKLGSGATLKLGVMP